MTNENMATALAGDTHAKAHITGIHFSSGKTITLKHDSILVLIGPNNAGKSQTLRDIYALLESPSKGGVSVTKAPLEKAGDEEAFWAHFKRWGVDKDNQAHFFGGGSLSPASALVNFWNGEGLGYATRLFAILLTADVRIGATKAPPRIRRGVDSPHVPLHQLELERRAEKDTSDAFKRIFETEIALDRNAGGHIPVHVGARPNASDCGGELSLEYAEAVSLLPRIEDQGDGMIAFLGLMMYIVAIPRDIYLIDEPDVYLHPPQAYAAARLLANASSDRQLFLATHNAHFLRGLLDEAKERVVLIRLDRNGGSQSVNAIDLALFDEPSAGPLLKFTPVLESAFYRTVVVCENEADCLFYRALLERLGKIGPSSPVFWLSAHGKQNVRNVTALLNNLGVRALSIVDFDVINDEAVLKSLVKAHGGDWDTFRTDFDLMQRSVAEKKPSLAAAEVAAEVLKIMEPLRAAQGLFPTSAKDQIREIFRRASPWREVKESGLAALAKGQVAQAAQRVLANLADIGILVVPVGEMESFCRTIEGDGIKWVEQVLKKDLGTDPELAEARSFADRVAAKLQQ